MLNAVMLSVTYAECHLCWVSEISLYAKFHYGECSNAECRYAECRYAECFGTHWLNRPRHIDTIDLLVSGPIL
jgi:hypothetical protein